jgi:CRISPR-associated exonuclease Cas4
LGLKGAWNLYPVEFKRGKTKRHDADRVQVCAQALCLEEMTGERILEGALFYGEVRRREQVVFDERLRQTVEKLAARLHDIISQNILPAPVPKAHCKACSLNEICQPRAPRADKAAQYRRELFE